MVSTGLPALVVLLFTFKAATLNIGEGDTGEGDTGF